MSCFFLLFFLTALVWANWMLKNTSSFHNHLRKQNYWSWCLPSTFARTSDPGAQRTMTVMSFSPSSLCPLCAMCVCLKRDCWLRHRHQNGRSASCFPQSSLIRRIISQILCGQSRNARQALISGQPGSKRLWTKCCCWPASHGIEPRTVTKINTQLKTLVK